MSDSQVLTEIANEKGSMSTRAAEFLNQSHTYEHKEHNMTNSEYVHSTTDATEPRLVPADTEDVDSFPRLAASDAGPQVTEEGYRARIIEMQAAAEQKERLALEPQIANSFSTGEFTGADHKFRTPVDRMSMTWDKLNLYEVHELEEIVTRISEDTAVTRSHNGYRVLNTPTLTFFDVDFDPRMFKDFDRLAGNVLANVTAWVADNPEEAWSFRVYRTACGVRIMMTHRPGAVDVTFDAICTALGVDPLYEALCHTQGLFRARLSPKPTRIGFQAMNLAWPVYGDWHLDRFVALGAPRVIMQCEREKVLRHSADRLKIEAYELLAQPFATCKLLCVIGANVIHSDLRSLVELHDRECKVTGHAAPGVALETIHPDEYNKPSDDEIKTFDHIFRPGPLGSKMAPDSIWCLLSPVAQSMIKELDLKRTSERELKRQARAAMTSEKRSADADSEDVFLKLANASRHETAA